MPRQVLFAMLVESALIALTLLFLAQPKIVFGYSSEKVRISVILSGIVLLSITFCWSVIFGCILVLHEFRI